jgi:hypothetical protein
MMQAHDTISNVIHEFNSHQSECIKVVINAVRHVLMSRLYKIGVDSVVITVRGPYTPDHTIGHPNSVAHCVVAVNFKIPGQKRFSSRGWILWSKGGFC